MILYLDSSSRTKLYIDEEGSEHISGLRLRISEKTRRWLPSATLQPGVRGLTPGWSVEEETSFGCGQRPR